MDILPLPSLPLQDSTRATNYLRRPAGRAAKNRRRTPSAVCWSPGHEAAAEAGDGVRGVTSSKGETRVGEKRKKKHDCCLTYVNAEYM